MTSPLFELSDHGSTYVGVEFVVTAGWMRSCEQHNHPLSLSPSRSQRFPPNLLQRPSCLSNVRWLAQGATIWGWPGPLLVRAEEGGRSICSGGSEEGRENKNNRWCCWCCWCLFGSGPTCPISSSRSFRHLDSGWINANPLGPLIDFLPLQPSFACISIRCGRGRGAERSKGGGGQLRCGIYARDER